MLKARDYNGIFLEYPLCLEMGVFLWKSKLEMEKWAGKLNLWHNVEISTGKCLNIDLSYGWKNCHNDLLTYVPGDEGDRFFLQIAFPHTGFYKTIASLSLKGTLWELMYFPWFDIQIYWVQVFFFFFTSFQIVLYGFIKTDKDKQI